MKPLVSVVMSTYNNAPYLAQAIKSVLRQTFTDWEFIIINDASTDKTSAILQKYTRLKKFVIINNPQNKGLIHNLNLGIRKAKGRYIARIDSDDYWCAAAKLAKQIDFLEKNPNYALLGTRAKLIDKNGKYPGDMLYPALTDKKIRCWLLYKNQFIHSSVVFRKKAVLAAGGYFENEKYVEDYGLWLRLGKKYKFSNLPQTTVAYRTLNTSISAQKHLAQTVNSLYLIRKYAFAYFNFLLPLALGKRLLGVLMPRWKI